MANDLMIPSGNGKLAVPAHIAARFADESNIVTGDRVPRLGLRGKAFHMTVDGETTTLVRKDTDGNEEPLANLPVVILDYAATPGRSYYDSDWNAEETKAPVCYSLDGIAPEPESEKIQSDRCSTCPMSVKGSKATDNGKMVTACQINRLLAVVPVRKLDMDPLMLRIAQTSNYDGKSPQLKAAGRFAFDNYLGSLKPRGIPDTRSIVTNLSFVTEESYPKLTFKTVRWLEDHEIKKVDEILTSGKIEAILGRTSVLAQKANPALRGPRPAAALPAPAAKAAPVKAEPAAVVIEDDEEDDAEAKLLAQLAALKAAKSGPSAAELAAKKAADEKAAAEAAAAAEAKRKADEKAARLAKLQAEIEAAKAAPVDPEPDEEDDEEAKLMAQLLALKAAKDGAKADGAPAAAAPAAEPPARKRRTKAEMEAARAAEAAAQVAASPSPRTGPATADEGEKFLPKAIDASGFGGDEDEDGDFAEPTAVASKPANGKAAPKKVIEATAAAVPQEIDSVLATWDD